MNEESHCWACHHLGIGHPPILPDIVDGVDVEPPIMIMPPCEGCDYETCDECHEKKDVIAIYARCLFHSLLLYFHEVPCNTAHDFALSFGSSSIYGRLFDRALDLFLASYKDGPSDTIPDVPCSEHDFITFIQPLDIDEKKLMEILTNATSVLFQKLLKSYRYGMANDKKPAPYYCYGQYYIGVINTPTINDFLP